MLLGGNRTPDKFFYSKSGKNLSVSEKQCQVQRDFLNSTDEVAEDEIKESWPHTVCRAQAIPRRIDVVPQLSKLKQRASIDF